MNYGYIKTNGKKAKPFHKYSKKGIVGKLPKNGKSLRIKDSMYGDLDMIGGKSYNKIGPKMSALTDIGTMEGKRLLKGARSSLG